MTALFLVLALIFSPIAAAMAFLNTYQEYRRHFPERRKALKVATETAIVTFVLFVSLFSLAGFVFSRLT